MTSYFLPPISNTSRSEAEKMGIKFHTPESPEFEAIAKTITPLEKIQKETVYPYITAPIVAHHRRISKKGVDEL